MMKVSELHPKDIALVTAMYIVDRVQSKIQLHECEYPDLDPNFIVSFDYLSRGFLSLKWQELSFVKEDAELIEMICLNSLAWEETSNA